MKKKKLIIISAAAVFCLLTSGAYIAMQGGIAAEIMAVQKGEIKQYVEETASVRCREKQTVFIEVTGKITGIKFDTGTAVKKGDVLLMMDSTDLEMQLKDANAKVDAARSQIDSTKTSNYGNKIEIATAAVEQAWIARNSAQLNLERIRVLYESGAVSRLEFEKVQDANDLAAATLKAAESELEEIKKGTPAYVKKGYIAQLEQALVLRDSVQRSIDKMQVVSPIDGVILEKFADENSIVSVGTPAFVIGDTKVLELEANILSDDSYKVKLGDAVEITGKYLKDAVITGKVISIAPSAKTMTSTLGVNQKRVQTVIEITGDYGLLKPGYNVDIKIVTDTKKDTITVPDSAVFDYKGSSSIFIIDNGKAIIQKVQKGLEGNKLIEITEGLNEGDIILVKPDNNIKEGIKIKSVK